jgi:hypothetical protein
VPAMRSELSLSTELLTGDEKLIYHICLHNKMNLRIVISETSRENIDGLVLQRAQSRGKGDEH